MPHDTSSSPRRKRRKMLQLSVLSPLDEAVKLAASREMTSISDYVRRVLIERLRADGIRPDVASARAALMRWNGDAGMTAFSSDNPNSGN